MAEMNKSIEPEIMEVELFDVIGIKRFYKNDEMAKVPQQWVDFRSKIVTIPNKLGQTHYGIVVDTSDKGDMHYLTAVGVSNLDEIPAHMEGMRIEPQTYARFEHNGPITEIAQTWGAIFNQWFPNNRDRVLLGVPMFERYGFDYDEAKKEGRVDIFIPVR